MSYRKGKCNTCGYLQSSESEYMKPYCTCHKKVMKERNKIMKASSTCPLCGVDSPHVHSPLEQLIFKNGVKSAQPTSQYADAIAKQAVEEYKAGLVPVGVFRGDFKGAINGKVEMSVIAINGIPETGTKLYALGEIKGE